MYGCGDVWKWAHSHISCKVEMWESGELWSWVGGIVHSA